MTEWEVLLHSFTFVFHGYPDSVNSEWTVDVDKRIYKGIQSGMDRGFIQKGDPVIIITGWKSGSGFTNTMRIINAVDVANKDLLDPITGITSVPNLKKMESGLSK